MAIQVLGVVAVTVGAIISFVYLPALDNTHGRLGLAIIIAVWIQPLLALARPHPGARLRLLWFSLHWLLGVGAIVAGWVNVFSGLHFYVKRHGKQEVSLHPCYFFGTHHNIGDCEPHFHVNFDVVRFFPLLTHDDVIDTIDVKLFLLKTHIFRGMLQTLWTIIVVLMCLFGALYVISLASRILARFFFRSSKTLKESSLGLNQIENGNGDTREGEGDGTIADSDNVENDDDEFRWTKAARRHGTHPNVQESP